MRRSFSSRSRRSSNEEETVWISFSDLMTALLTVFMLAAVALVYSLREEQDALAAERATVAEFDSVVAGLGANAKVRAALVISIRDKLAAQGISVEVDSTNSVVSIPVDQLGFDSGSYEIRTEYQQNALTIGRVITEVLLEDERYRQLDTVFVEGHTDNVPIDTVYGGNWGLSTNRAISLWRLWETDLDTPPSTLDSHSGQQLFSVSGYADTRPITLDQTTQNARESNRRIDIRFTEHRLSNDELETIREAGNRQ